MKLLIITTTIVLTTARSAVAATGRVIVLGALPLHVDVDRTAQKVLLRGLRGVTHVARPGGGSTDYMKDPITDTVVREK